MFIDPLEARVLFAAGDVDPYFGDAGTMESGRFVLPAPDGRIYTVAPEPGNRSVTIRRIDANGLLDPKYNVTLSPPKDLTAAEMIDTAPAIDSRGRVFVPLRGGIFCVSPNGKLDTSFGKGGVVNSPLGYSVMDIAVQRDDRIVIAGSQRKQIGLDDEEKPFFAEAAAVARMNPDGSLDSTFGTNGVQLESDFSIYRVELPETLRINDVALDASNRLILLRKLALAVETSDSFQEHTDYDVLALNPNGSQDESFANIDGGTHFETDNYFEAFFARRRGRPPQKLIVDSSNRIVILRGEGDPETEPTGVLRVLPDGTLDTSFGGGDGFVDVSFADLRTIDVGTGFALANGKIFLAALTRPFNVVIALNSDGTRDTTFGTDGLASLGHSPRFAGLARDGSILVNTAFVDRATNVAAYELKRLWRDGAPAAIASVKNISAAKRTVVIDVAYRDDGSIDTDTLDNQDLRVSGPNGFARYARFDSIVSTTNDDGLVVARYKLSTPGGSWAGRNGTYDVRIRAGQVRDDDGNGIASRSIATFIVNVPNASRPASVRSTPAAQMIQRGDVFNDTALIDIDELL